MKKILKQLNGGMIFAGVIMITITLIGKLVEWIVNDKTRIIIAGIIALGLAIKWILSAWND